MSLLPLAAVAAPRQQQQQEQPPSALLYSQDELSRTVVQCKFVEPHGSVSFGPTDEIACDFTETLLRIPDAAEDAAKAATLEREWEAWWKTVLASKEPLKEVAKVCAPVQRDVEARQQHLLTSKYAAALEPALARDKALAEKVCACSTLPCYHDAMRDRLRLNAEEAAATCTVSQNAAWKLQLKRTETGWTHIASPPDPCYSSSTQTLSRGSGANANEWTLRILNVPLRGADPFWCDGAVVDRVFGPHYFGLVTANCRFVEFH